jgi:hypothetical protein
MPIRPGLVVEVERDGTTLRAAPSSAAVNRSDVPPGTRLKIIGPSEEREGQIWWPVAVEETGTGWVQESAIVAAEIPPTPTTSP